METYIHCTFFSNRKEIQINYKNFTKFISKPNLKRMRLVAKIFANAIAVIIAAYLLPGIEIKDFLTAIVVAIVLALLNAVLKPILIVLTIPVTILTLGLFLLVINALMILLADYLVGGFQVDGFWWALLFSIVMTVIMSIFNGLEKSSEKNQ